LSCTGERQYVGYCKPVSPEKIIDIVSNFKANKSPGPDKIGPRLVKIILHDILDPLQYICNLSFETGVVPSKLIISKVIPAYKKANKMFLEIIGQYIILSVFDKLLEKLMYFRISDFLEKHYILYKYQFGFRKYHSISIALIDMIDNIYDNMDKKNATIGVFLDLQKAFDTVDHEILLYKMYLYGIRGIVLHMVQGLYD